MSGSFLFFFLCLVLLFKAALCRGGGAAGGWQLLQRSIGISAMHMQLLHNDRVIIYDRTDTGRSNLSLPDGKCRGRAVADPVLRNDCTAHSVEYDVASNSVRPLVVQTDVWCSSGTVLADGRLVQTGGTYDGERNVRVFNPCAGCDWEEIPLGLAAPRWYSTDHILPDGRLIIVGGRGQFNYEFYPKRPGTSDLYSLPFLRDTYDSLIENNLYPFVHLNVDGNLFIFANNRAILLDYVKNRVVKTYPAIPGGDPRSFPSTGSSALLPLNLRSVPVHVEVLVCGGAPKGSFMKASNGEFLKALDTCGRIKLNEASPKWEMETMPLGRVMGDMILLPNGDVLIINGAGEGTAGWENGRSPVLHPVLYQPGKPAGSRFRVEKETTVPRLYHSTALLLRDGRVLVGGSNPHNRYSFSGVLFPTELRLEAFHPRYLDQKFSNLRPKIVAPASHTELGYSQPLAVRFSVPSPVAPDKVSVTMVAPTFTTHSFSMNQRVLLLGGENVVRKRGAAYEIQVVAPASPNLAPSGYYLLFVVHTGVPSKGIWVHIQ